MLDELDVPETVTAALADRSVAGAVCLEAGAGIGNMTAGLLNAGADRVYAVTTDREDACMVRDRITGSRADQLVVAQADVGALPIAADSVDLITAHGLFNLLPVTSVSTIAAELTRIAAPGCEFLIDDYEPLPRSAAVHELFALENAAMELANGHPALVFYPAVVLQGLFTENGWRFIRKRTLLNPVPWTDSHINAHANAARRLARRAPDGVTSALLKRIESVSNRLDPESVGEMYSIAMDLPDRSNESSCDGVD